MFCGGSRLDNIDLIKGWIQLALNDWSVIKSLDYSVHRGPIVYHLQQFVEKLCKAILIALGFESPKTHFPSRLIDSILIDIELGHLNIQISRKEKEILEKISSLAKSIEDEGVRPRYGIRHIDLIILPDEIYSEDRVKLFERDARYIAFLVWSFLESRSYCKEIPDECTRLRELWGRKNY